MITSTERILSVVARHDAQDAFLAAEDACDIVPLHFERLSGAARRTPQEVADRHQKVPWRGMQDTRNRIVHWYFSVNSRLLWRLAVDTLPTLRPQLQDVMTAEQD